MAFETALPFDDLLMWSAYSVSVDLSEFGNALTYLWDEFPKKNAKISMKLYTV